MLAVILSRGLLTLFSANSSVSPLHYSFCLIAPYSCSQGPSILWWLTLGASVVKKSWNWPHEHDRITPVFLASCYCSPVSHIMLFHWGTLTRGCWLGFVIIRHIATERWRFVWAGLSDQFNDVLGCWSFPDNYWTIKGSGNKLKCDGSLLNYPNASPPILSLCNRQVRLLFIWNYIISFIFL